MAGMSSQGWEPLPEEVLEIDGNLLMELLEESHVLEAEDEQLGCQSKIDHSEVLLGGTAEALCEDDHNLMDCGLETVGFVDPFDWIDVDVVANSHCDEMGNWYVEDCRGEVEMVQFVDAGDGSPFYCGDYSYSSLENAYGYSPLWQETFDSI